MEACQALEFSRQEYWSGLPFSSPGIAIAFSSGLPFPDPGTELPSTYVINTSIALALCQALYYTSHGNSNQAFSMCPFTRGENGGPGWLRACWVAGSRGGACTWPWSRRRATSVPVVCVCLLATSLSDTRAWAPQILTMGLLCTFRTKVQNTGSSCYKVSQGPASSARPPQRAPRRGRYGSHAAPTPSVHCPMQFAQLAQAPRKPLPQAGEAEVWVIPERVRLTPGGGLGDPSGGWPFTPHHDLHL